MVLAGRCAARCDARPKEAYTGEGLSQPRWRPTQSGFNQEIAMLKYAVIFAFISLIAASMGFSGLAAGSAGIAKVLFGLFLILAFVFLVLAALGVGAVKKLGK